MLTNAVKKYNINLEKSILVGDKSSDIEAGLNVGIQKITLNRNSQIDEIYFPNYIQINTLKKLKLHF